MLHNGIVGVYANPTVGLDSANLGANCFFPIDDVKLISEIDVVNLIRNLETLGVQLTPEQLEALNNGVKTRNDSLSQKTYNKRKF